MAEPRPSIVAKWAQGVSLRAYLLSGAGAIAFQAVVLIAMGQPPICECGTIALWNGLTSGPENSQQLTDWYTYSHVIHGIGFYLVLWLVFPHMPIGLRFALALGLEAGWEILENTPLIIDRYRQQALAQGYFGDSVVNSVSDTLAAALGFVLARSLPVWTTIALLIGIEAFMLYLIRDNLTLNIIQLIYPSEAISSWQASG